MRKKPDALHWRDENRVYIFYHFTSLRNAHFYAVRSSFSPTEYCIVLSPPNQCKRAAHFLKHARVFQSVVKIKFEAGFNEIP